MTPRIFIDGEHGTTGLQIRARLAQRPDVSLISLPQAERRNADLRAQMLRAADIVILCLPDDAARQAAAMLDGEATRIIDASSAHRTDPDWIYGFPEMEPGQAERIAGARRISNPGCYSTGAIALIRPLVAAGILPPDYPVTINAVSGYSGGGRQLIEQMEQTDHPDHITAPYFLYGLALQHKHVPEMQAHGLLARPPLFSPSVGRFAQGMIVQVPLHLADLNGGVDLADLHAALAAHYGGHGTVAVRPLDESAAQLRLDPTELAGSDVMKLSVHGTAGTGQVNLVASLDNLGKGASGAAVQNMDLMLGRSTASTS